MSIMDASEVPSTNPSPKPNTKLVDGFPIPGRLPVNNYRATLSYQPRDDDIFIATYPKCGTTWAQHILLLIFRQGEPHKNMMEFMMATPYIEFMGLPVVEKMPRPGAIKTHLPYHLAPKSSKAKYIYISRNPKDCCVSYYHHMKDVQIHDFTGTFDQFFECFITGDIDYGDYFDHLLGWYAHRNDPNVLFLTYEQMKENPIDAILRMASFIDDKLYAEPLRSDPEKLQNVIKFSSFKHMKEKMNTGMVEEMVQLFQSGDISKFGLPPEVLEVFTLFQSLAPDPSSAAAPAAPSMNFIRKGIIGDWRNYFSPEQSKRLDEKFAERTKAYTPVFSHQSESELRAEYGDSGYHSEEKRLSSQNCVAFQCHTISKWKGSI